MSSSLGNFKSSFATIGGKIGKFVKKASDFLSSNNNVVGRLLNKARNLKNVVVKKAFKVLDNADSFVAKFISRFPAPIRLKLEDVIQQPLGFLKGKIGEADNKLSSWLNPVEAQLNRLKDRYIPDLAKEMMLEDNVYKDDFENREEQDVSQEYIDQAKGTVESELDERATAHVNKNIENIEKELDTAEDRVAEIEKEEKERKEKEEKERKVKKQQNEEDRKEEDAKAEHEEDTKRWEVAKKAEEETKEKDRKEAHEKKLEADRVAKLAERKKEEADKLAEKKEEQAVKAKSRAAEEASKKAAAKAKEEMSKEEAAKSRAEEATKREKELQAKEVKSKEEAAKSKAEEATKREKALPFLQAKEKNNEDDNTAKELKARAGDMSSKKHHSSTSSVLKLKNPAKTQGILASKRKTPQREEVRRRVPKRI